MVDPPFLLFLKGCPSHSEKDLQRSPRKVLLLTTFVNSLRLLSISEIRTGTVVLRA